MRDLPEPYQTLLDNVNHEWHKRIEAYQQARSRGWEASRLKYEANLFYETRVQPVVKLCARYLELQTSSVVVRA